MLSIPSIVTLLVGGVSLVIKTCSAVSTQDYQFCGPQPCYIPLMIPCRKLVNEYNFQGSCCSLVDIPATGGCRVTVAANGDCAWVPKCGQCHPSIGCNKIYQTTSTNRCPASIYKVLHYDKTTAGNSQLRKKQNSSNITASTTSGGTLTVKTVTSNVMNITPSVNDTQTMSMTTHSIAPTFFTTEPPTCAPEPTPAPAKKKEAPKSSVSADHHFGISNFEYLLIVSIGTIICMYS